MFNTVEFPDNPIILEPPKHQPKNQGILGSEQVKLSQCRVTHLMICLALTRSTSSLGLLSSNSKNVRALYSDTFGAADVPLEVKDRPQL